MNRLYLTVVVTVLSLVTVNGQDFGEEVQLISVEGLLETRVHCIEQINCMAVNVDLVDNVIWTFFGVGTTPLPNTDDRFVSYNTSVINGTDVIIATLILNPVMTSHGTLYQCQTLGMFPFSTTLVLSVNPKPLEIASELPNIDISDRFIGGSLSVVCQVKTCVSDLLVTLRKNGELFRTDMVTGNTNDSVNVAFLIDIKEDTAGKYSCEAVASEGSTLPTFFNITGTPRMEPDIATTSSSVPVAMTTQTTPTTISTNGATSTSANTAGSSTSGSGSGTTLATMPTITESTISMAPTSSMGGGSMATTVVQWTVLLSLVLVTFVNSLLVL